MNERLWYPQLDLYDCIRRLGALLLIYSDPPGLERLCIADFYLANPPLLHHCKMTRDTRQRFRQLKIQRPEKTFLTYPAPPLLFKSMESVQREALSAMTGKNLLSIEQLQIGLYELTQLGQETIETVLMNNFWDGECDLINFLTKVFVTNGEVDLLVIRQNTGLRRTVL